jgi:hypothetical protein
VFFNQSPSTAFEGSKACACGPVSECRSSDQYSDTALGWRPRYSGVVPSKRVTHMPPRSIAPAIAACEAALQQIIDYNTSQECWPSQTAIARRLLGQRLMLASAYDEVHRKLGPTPRALYVFLDTVLHAAAGWSPDQLRRARDERHRLEAVNRAIAEHAHSLGALLDERDALANTSGFRAGTLYHPGAWIVKAGNGRFRSFVREPLEALMAQFDLKYWPDLGTLCRVLADDAAGADVSPADPLTAAGVEGQRASLANFVAALFVGIDETRVREHGPLPDTFGLKDDHWAALVTAALDLPADQVITGDYIKGVRQRSRRRGS